MQVDPVDRGGVDAGGETKQEVDGGRGGRAAGDGEDAVVEGEEAT